MATTAEITVLPIGREGASVGDLVAEIAKALASQERVHYEMHGMGTSLEGEAEDIFELAARLHRIPLEHNIPRAYTILKVDQRTDKDQTLDSKVESVSRHLA